MKLLLLIAALFSSVATAAEIDADRSVFKWKGSKITGSFHEGLISPKSSTVTLKDGVIATAEVVMDLTSLTVTDIKDESKAGKFLRHMLSEDFFNVAKFPSATLTVSSIENNQATGALAILGQSQPISFPIKKDGDKYVGKMLFDRTVFGVTYRSGSFFAELGDRVINDEVEVTFEVYVKE